ncbi:MAG: hypothetical protein FJ286_08855, partial [Planctomycetes bacterium]|nr:hypothetical protein [Planctomycetota bacterium]
NILWTDAGYAIAVDSSSQLGFASDYNLFWNTANGKVGLWEGIAQATLANWRTATSQDSRAVFGSPIFVDLDGADDVLAYTTDGTGYDGGRDDNFYIRRLSPAIDAANSPAGPATDRYGQARVDDPGTANTGTGIADIGAVEFLGSSLDTTPPTVIATFPAPIASSGAYGFTRRIDISFSEGVNAIDALAIGNYELVKAGSSGFGSPDDVFYTLTPSSRTTVATGILAVRLDLGLAGASLPNGQYRLTVRGAASRAIHDSAGNTLDGDADGTAGGDWVRSFTVDQSIDITPPVVTVNPLLTNNPRPTITGTIDDQTATIAVTLAGQTYTITNSGTGTWSLAGSALVAPLAEGTYDVVVTATDPSSNAGTDSTTAELVVDLTAPSVTLTPLVTNQTRPAFTGTVDDPLATVSVTIAGQSYPAVNSGTGTWSLSGASLAAPLAEGVYAVVVSAADAAGNSRSITSSTGVTIDLTPPAVTVTPQTVFTSRPTITGTVNDPTATISVTIAGTTYSAINAGDGTWSLAGSTLAQPLTVGTYNVTAVATDGAGNSATDATTGEIVYTGDAEGDTLATALPLTLSTATLVHAATIGDGAYGASDVDLFQVTLAAGTKLTAEIFARRLTPPSGIDSYLRLFNAAGQPLASDDDSAGSNDSRISQFTIPTSGTYYVGVSAYGNSGYDPTTTSGRGSGSTGAYELHLTAVAPDTNTAPTAVSVLPIYTTLPKTSASGAAARVAVADIVVDDDGQGTNVFSLSGANAADFEVRDDGLSGFRLYLKAGVVLDPAIQAVKSVTVSVRDSSLPDAPVSATYSASVTDEAAQLVFGQWYSSTLPSAIVARPQHFISFYLTGAAIDAATLSLADFVLTRDGATVPWTAAAGGGDTPQLNIYGTSGSIDGIGHLTAAKGAYQIRFTGDATDIVGTPLPTTTLSWTNTSPVSRLDGANGWAFLMSPTTDSAWLNLAGLTVADDGSTITFGSFGGTVDFDSRPDVTTTLTSGNGGAGQSGFVARYDASGALLSAWSVGAVIDAIATSGNRLTIGGTFSGSGVDLDPRPGVATSNDAGSDTAFFLVAFDAASGVPSATHVYPTTPATGGGGSSWSSSYLTAITTTADGRLYFSGRLESASIALGSSSGGPVGLSVPAGRSDGFVAALAANGSPLWAQRMQDGSTDTYATAVPRNLTFVQPSGSSDVLALGVTRIATLGIVPGDAAPADGEALVIGLNATSGAYRWRSSVIAGAVDPGDSVPMTLTSDGRLHAAANVWTKAPSGDGRVESGMITINPTTGTRIGSPQSLGALLGATTNVYVSGLLPRSDNAVVVAGKVYGSAPGVDDSMYLLHVPASTGSGTPTVTSRQYLHSGWPSASGITADGRLVFTSSVNDSDTYPTGSSFALERLISPNQYDAAVWSIRDPFATSTPTGIDVPTGQTITDATIRTGSYQLVKQGGGTLILDQANTHSGGTVVEAGTVIVKHASAFGTGEVRIKAGATLVIDPAAGEAVAGSLVIEDGGFVDLGAGRMLIVSNATAPSLVGHILAAQGDGSWTALTGLGSSAAAEAATLGQQRRIGWLDNGDGSFTVAFAAPGDTNLDGFVDVLDAANFFTSGKYYAIASTFWVEGDFNYDDVLDILDIADFFGTSLFNSGTYLTSGRDAEASPAPGGTEPTAAASGTSAFDSALVAFTADQEQVSKTKRKVFATFR